MISDLCTSQAIPTQYPKQGPLSTGKPANLGAQTLPTPSLPAARKKPGREKKNTYAILLLHTSPAVRLSKKSPTLTSFVLLELA